MPPTLRPNRPRPRLPARLAGAALALLPGAPPALAATEPAAPALAAGGVVLLVLLVFLGGAWLLLRRLAAAGPSDQPLGVPEGSVRALLSAFIVVFGFLLLALQGPLGLQAGEALTGFVGAVISFYFAARGAEQSRRLVEGAAEALRGAAEATRAAAPPEAPSPPDLAPLRDAAGRLGALRALFAAAGGLARGAGPLQGAAEALARIDGLLGRLAPVLDGRADAASVGALAEEAGAALRDFDGLGPVGAALAEAATSFGRAAGESAPIGRAVSGLLGSGLLGGGGAALAGPAGLVAALVSGGLALAQDRERFDRWKAALLARPLDLGLLPATPDGALAATALLRVPLLAARLAPEGRIEPALALAVWEAASPDPASPAEPAAARAARLLSAEPTGAGTAALRTAFAGHAEALAEAIGALRAAMAALSALHGLDLPPAARGAAEAAQALREDPRAAAAIETVVQLVEATAGAAPAAAILADPARLRAATGG